MPNPVRIIFLNGVSSAGKTTLCTALQDTLDEPYLYIGLDDAYRMLPKRFQDFTDPSNRPYIRQAVSGVNHCIAGLAAAGNNVLVDYVMTGMETLTACARLLEPYPVWFVAVKCEREELELREKSRGRFGDRALVHKQFDTVHAAKVYDLDVDTTHATPQACAEIIKQSLVAGPAPTAFERIRTGKA